jgi:CheY-like chemotaxis protein
VNSILVVDDSPEAREGAREALEVQGYRVAEATDGREALQMLTGGTADLPALILLDLEMPYMTGWDLIRLLSSYHRLASIPVLVVTAHERTSLAPTRSVVGLLRKPYGSQELLSAVQACTRACALQSTDITSATPEAIEIASPTKNERGR